MAQTVVIGGGAAGLAAAVSAARAGFQVTVLERTDTLGKKLLSTGNGRCNLTNRAQAPSFYHCNEENFPLGALKRFPLQAVLDFFESLGLSFKEREGYVYPRSLKASSVRDALLSELRVLGADVRTGAKVTGIFRDGNRLLVKTAETSFGAEGVILACGGKAFPASGSDGSGYLLAESLGHRVIPPVPALVPLYAEKTPLAKAEGVRAAGRIDLYDGARVRSAAGELQITGFGISGIPAFQVSRYAARALSEGRPVKAVVSFLPEYDVRKLPDRLAERIRRLPGRDFMELLSGWFPEKLSAALLKKAGIPLHIPARDPSPRVLQALSGAMAAFPLNIVGTGDFSKAQVTAGGVDAAQVDPDTMESRIFPGLYFAGEILDVDGDCGGYNLHWAWASGLLAGKQGKQ